MSQNDQIDANDWLLGTSVRSAKFEEVGAQVVGHVLRPPEVQHQRDFTTGEPKYWPDGKPRLQLKVVLMTEEQDPEDPEDSGERAVYVKGFMQKAVSDAVRKAGAPGLQVGGKLLVRYAGDGKITQRGMNPPKLYSARYKPPEAAAVPVPEPDLDGGDWSEPAQAQPRQQVVDLSEVPF